MNEYILENDKKLTLDWNGAWSDKVDDAVVISTKHPQALKDALGVIVVPAPVLKGISVIYILGENQPITLAEFLDDHEDYDDGTVEEVFFDIWRKRDMVTPRQVLTMLEEYK